MLLDAVVSLGSLLAPPLFKFVKDKFSPKTEKTVETTLSSLATSNPAAIPEFIKAQASLIEAQIKHFNRDVSGQVSVWVNNLRASIRPIYVIFGIVYFFLTTYMDLKVDPCIRVTMETCINSWFGSRI